MDESFSEKVYLACRKIPAGKIATYGDIARSAGFPRAARAVGNALNRNPDPLCKKGQVPCHRVVRADGKVGGFAFGKKKKIRMLKQEGIEIRNGKIPDIRNFRTGSS